MQHISSLHKRGRDSMHSSGRRCIRRRKGEGRNQWCKLWIVVFRVTLRSQLVLENWKRCRVKGKEYPSAKRSVSVTVMMKLVRRLKKVGLGEGCVCL